MSGNVGVDGSMCPAPMAFHDECWERAAYLWQPDPDSSCQIADPLYPETGQWVRAQQQEENNR